MSVPHTQLSPFDSNFRLGIVGGGQLGKMLLADANRMDLKVHVLDPDANAVAANGADKFEVGSLTDFGTVLAFGLECDAITIEIENVNVEALTALEAIGKRVFPQPRVIGLLQDKIEQKDFYAANKLPTAPYRVFNQADGQNKAGLLDYLNGPTVKYPIVWKAAKGGYDGKGVQVLQNQADAESLPDVPCLLELAVPIQKELAVVLARDEAGQVTCYPTIEMEFDERANLVRYCACPAVLPRSVHQKAYSLAYQTAEALGIVGVLAVELFYTTSGELLINECAPRVHNSAHFTIEAAYTSQFEQHLRAVLGLPFGSSALIQPAVMLNLTGEPEHSGPVHYEGVKEALAESGLRLHLYGKAETRPFRKMGHATITATSLRTAWRSARYAESVLKIKAVEPAATSAA